MAGRALNDSIRIVTKFSDMEETYSSQKFLRYVRYASFMALFICKLISVSYYSNTHNCYPSLSSISVALNREETAYLFAVYMHKYLDLI